MEQMEGDMKPAAKKAAIEADMQKIQELVQQLARAALDRDWENMGRLRTMIEIITEQYTAHKPARWRE